MPTTTTTTFPGTDRAAERWTAGFTAAAAGLAAAVVLVAGGMAPHPGSSTATPANDDVDQQRVDADHGRQGGLTLWIVATMRGGSVWLYWSWGPFI